MQNSSLIDRHKVIWKILNTNKDTYTGIRTVEIILCLA